MNMLSSLDPNGDWISLQPTEENMNTGIDTAIDTNNSDAGTIEKHHEDAGAIVDGLNYDNISPPHSHNSANDPEYQDIDNSIDPITDCENTATPEYNEIPNIKDPNVSSITASSRDTTFITILIMVCEIVITFLKRLRDFTVCCFLAIYSIPVCIVGSSIIVIVRILPSIFHQWEVSVQRDRLVLVWVLFTTFTTVVGFVVGFMIAVIIMPVYLPPKRYLTEGYLSGLYGPFAILSMVDEGANYFMDEYVENGGGWKVLPFLKNNISGSTSSSRNTNLGRNSLRNVHQKYTSSRNVRNVNPGDTSSRNTNLGGGGGNDIPHSSKASDQYWDTFISQCIMTTSELIEARWITTDDVKSMDPAVIISIPAIAILSIIFDSATERGLQKEDIKRSIDGTVCKEEDRPIEGAILHLLWPLVDEMKNTLISNDKLLEDRANMRVIMAMLCDNGEDCTEELKDFLKATEFARSATEKIFLTTKVSNFVLEMTRFGPYLNRMSKIYTHEYVADVEEGHRRAVDISSTVVNYGSPDYENQREEGIEVTP